MRVVRSWLPATAAAGAITDGLLRASAVRLDWLLPAVLLMAAADSIATAARRSSGKVVVPASWVVQVAVGVLALACSGALLYAGGTDGLAAVPRVDVAKFVLAAVLAGVATGRFLAVQRSAA